MCKRTVLLGSLLWLIGTALGLDVTGIAFAQEPPISVTGTYCTYRAQPGDVYSYHLRSVDPSGNVDEVDTVTFRCAFPANEVTVARLTGGTWFRRTSLTIGLGRFDVVLAREGKETRDVLSSASPNVPRSVTLYLEWYAAGLPMLRALHDLVPFPGADKTITEIELTGFARGNAQPPWPASGSYHEERAIEYYHAEFGHHFVTAIPWAADQHAEQRLVSRRFRDAWRDHVLANLTASRRSGGAPL